MSVYGDALASWGWRIHGRETQSCHLIADTTDELHAFANSIGMSRRWF